MMKKFGKIFLIVAVVVIAMLAMMTVASAASIPADGVSASVAADEGRTITVTVKYDAPETAQQSTILVVPQGVSITDPELDTKIKYIDQEAAGDGTVTYTFKLLENDRKGVYDVYVGGTAVDSPSTSVFSFDTRKIKGTISAFGTLSKASAVATPTAGGDAKNGTVAADGTYEIEVGQGDYKVVLGKSGYLYKTYDKVTVATSDVDLGAITLLGGDFNGDGEINSKDIQPAIVAYNASSQLEGMIVDINDDGVITSVDLQSALVNYNSTTASYK